MRSDDHQRQYQQQQHPNTAAVAQPQAPASDHPPAPSSHTLHKTPSRSSSLTSRDGTPYLTSSQILQARAIAAAQTQQPTHRIKQPPSSGRGRQSLDASADAPPPPLLPSKDSLARRLGIGIRHPSAFSTRRQSVALGSSYDTDVGESLDSSYPASRDLSHRITTTTGNRALPAAPPHPPSKEVYKRAWPTAATEGQVAHNQRGYASATSAPSRPGPAATSGGKGHSFRSLKKFFQSKSSKEKEAIAVDRTRRRRSYVELGTPSHEDPNDATPRGEQAPNWSNLVESSTSTRGRILPRSLRTAASSTRAGSSVTAPSNDSLERVRSVLSVSDRGTHDSAAVARRSDSLRTSSSFKQTQRPNGGGDYFSYSGPKTVTPSAKASNSYNKNCSTADKASGLAHAPQSSVESFGSFGSGSVSVTGPFPPTVTPSHHRLRSSASHPTLSTVIASPTDVSATPEAAPSIFSPISPAPAAAATALLPSPSSPSFAGAAPPVRPLGTPQATRSDSDLADKAKENATAVEDEIISSDMGKSSQAVSWRLPFGRKVSSSSKNEEQWDDAERGTGRSSPMNPSRSSDSTRARFGSSASSLRQNSVVDDLRETGYLPRLSAAPMHRGPSGLGNGRSVSSGSKIERMMGAGADAAAQQTMDRSASQPSVDHRASTSSSSIHDTSLATYTSARDETDAACPICLEPLSYRLAGERPHVMPDCGHALHNACFTAVYGKPEEILAARNGESSGKRSGGPPGMCGVCRKGIALGGGGGLENSRAAKLMGMMVSGNSRPRHSVANRRDEGPSGDDPIGALAMMRSASRGNVDSQSSHRSAMSSPASRTTLPELNGYDSSASPASPMPHQSVVHPLIRVRPEFNSIYRKDPSGQDGRQNVVCVVRVEVPSRRPPLSLDEEEARHQMHWRGLPTNDQLQHVATDEENADAGTDNGDTEDEHQADDTTGGYNAGSMTMSESISSSANDMALASSDVGHERLLGSGDNASLHNETQGDASGSGKETSNGEEEGFSMHATPAVESVSYIAVFEDLKTRIADWKGQPIEKFGQLALYDYLGISQDNVVRNFWVYLFNSALICVTESSKSGSRSESKGKKGMSSKAKLKLKGRIWLRHICEMIEVNVQGSASLGITLDDDTLGNFVLVFPNEGVRQSWRSKIELLADESKRNYALRHPTPAASIASSVTTATAGNRAAGTLRELPSVRAALDPSSYELNGSSPAKSTSEVTARSARSASLVSGKSGSDPASARVSTAATTPASSSPAKAHMQASPSSKQIRKTTSASALPSQRSNGSGSFSASLPTQQQWSASGGLDPSLPPPHLFPHAPIDLVLVVSVPVVTQTETVGVSSSAALKLRLIRSTLKFVASHMGPSDRLAIVTYSSGTDGDVRKTGLLSVSARDRSRAQINDFIESIGKVWESEEEDCFRVDSETLGGGSERTDTFTALNVGLDIVLSRRVKNAMTGMILINDTSDGPGRKQINLVLARAEAANTPIHCFGFGKSSNPSSLWVISSHTRGSYSFVPEWYQLRECIAGCIGSLMSTAIDQFKLRISVPSDNYFKVKKVQGVSNPVVSASGKHVDVDLGELRFGEVRELFVELELDFNGLVPFIAQTSRDGRLGVKKVQNAPVIEAGSATDEFMQRLGLSDLSLDETMGGGDLCEVDQAIENLIEEVAVFEVDAGYRDVATGSSTHRLSNPVVLTLEVDASTPEPGTAAVPQQIADATVTRRRIELLVADMITRSLLLVSRKNYSQALRIINETHKIVETVLRKLTENASAHGTQAINGHAIMRRTSMNNTGRPQLVSRGVSAVGPNGRSAAARQRALVHNQALVSLLAILDDLELISHGLQSGPRGHFERDGRNAAAQQAMVLRDQQAWTTRTTTEALRFLGDNGPAFAAIAYATSRS